MTDKKLSNGARIERLETELGALRQKADRADESLESFGVFQDNWDMQVAFIKEQLTTCRHELKSLSERVSALDVAYYQQPKPWYQRLFHRVDI